MTFQRLNIWILTSTLLMLVTLGMAVPTWAQAPTNQAPTRKVLVTNADKAARTTIQVKWYTDDIFYPEGVNVYRKETNEANFVKLNTEPIRQQKAVPAEEARRDSMLQNYVDAVLKRPVNEPLPGFIKLQFLVKSIKSAAFARFMGIEYDDEQVELGKTYEYRVMILKGGKETLLNTSASITASSFVPANAPGGITTTPLFKESIVNINWLPEEERFYAVNIYRKTEGQPKAELVNLSPLIISKTSNRAGKRAYPTVFYADSVMQGVKYQYQLTGVDFFGRETWPSKAVDVFIPDVTPPPAPDFPAFKADPVKQEVRLSWKPVVSKDLAGYHVYRSLTNKNNYQRVTAKIVPATDTVFIDKVAKSGQFYYYITATDRAGNEARSENVLTEVKDITPPAPPQGLTMQVDTGKVILRWSKNTEADFKGYFIYRTINKNTNKDFVLLNAKALTNTEFVDKVPKNVRNQLLYKVMAMDSAYNKSAASEVVFGRMPDVTAPIAPFIKSLVVEKEKLVLNWLPSTDPDLKGYQIYRSAGADSTKFALVNPTLLPGNTTSYIDAAIQPNLTYRYYLQAVDSTGNASERSNRYTGQVSALHSASKIAAPEKAKVVYNARKKEVALSWNVEERPELLGCMVFRRLGDQTFKPLTGLIKATDFVDKDVEKGLTYFYEIRAYDKSGAIAKSTLLQTVITE